MYQTIVSTQTLASQIDDPDWIILDCRFDIMRPEKGFQAFQKEHIPSAQYISLNDDMSSPVTATSGRHPLPIPKVLSDKLASCGVNHNSQVIVYDDANNSIAARMWWLLRWLGHFNVAALDGSLQKWCAEDLPLTDTVELNPKSDFQGTPDDNMWVITEQIESLLDHPDAIILDARAAQRFSGEHEPVDSAGGHIPGAVNHPLADNLDEQGCFLEPETLRAKYQDFQKSHTVHSCGSGVTACHNLLAMEIAGLGESKLYPGSWSEWIRSPDRPIATGE